MRGPYLLRPLQIDLSVPDKVGGIFCLANNPKQIKIVARAEKNLREAIKAYWKEYEFFWYEPALSPREAFINQCYAYHRFCQNSTFEQEHPKPPDKVAVKCPVCGT